MALFRFPEDARWNACTETLEFSVAVGAYEGTVRVHRDVLRRLVAGAATPERCLEAYHLNRILFERAAEAKLRRRELAADGDVDLLGVDFRRLDR